MLPSSIRQEAKKQTGIPQKGHKPAKSAITGLWPVAVAFPKMV